jgi:hypothetical protein
MVWFATGAAPAPYGALAQVVPGETAGKTAAEGASDDATPRFRAAVAARAVWGKDFPGFTASVELNVDGHVYTGKATVGTKGKTTLDLEGVAADSEARRWALGELISIVQHRGPGRDPSASENPTSYRFTEPDDSHPLGRRIEEVGDDHESAYRVRNDQILEVNRHMGKERFTITVLENTKNAEGHYLPRAFTVTFWDAETGKIARAITTHQEWTRVGNYDLPTVSSAVMTSDGKREIRRLTLTEHVLSNAAASASSK